MEPKLSISAELSNVAVIRRFVEQAAASFTADRDVMDDMIQAVEEAVTNVIFHGYHGQPGDIEIQVGKEDDTLTIHLRDHAFPFDPTQVPPPDLTLPLEMRRLGGLGIYLMRQFTDNMAYHARPEGGNELILRKSLSSTLQEDK